LVPIVARHCGMWSGYLVSKKLYRTCRGDSFCCIYRSCGHECHGHMDLHTIL